MVFRRRAESARRLLSQTYRNVHIAPLARTKKWEGPTRPPAGSRRARAGSLRPRSRPLMLVQLGWALTSLLREAGATDRFLIRLTAAVERLPR